MKTIEKISLKKEKSDYLRVKISSSRDSSDYIRQFYSDDLEIYESFFLLLLNRQNQTIGYAKISQGGVTGTVVDVKIIMKYIIDTLASGIILCHNHPSGNLTPSPQDISITEKIKNAASFVDTKVLDHIILTSDSYYSFCDEGTL